MISIKNLAKPVRAALCSLSIAAVASWAPGAAAEDTGLQVIDSAEAPWPSIGRVNVKGYRSTSMCTGTLIAPNIVLTAAHCFYNKSTLRPFQTADVLFMAGVRREDYSARLETACFMTASGYQPKDQPKLRDVHKDVGIIVLKTPSTLPPVPVLTLEEASILNKQTRFQSAGYRKSRRFLPTVVPSCRVMGTVEDSWVTDCNTESGASGGPLLVETPDGLRVAGVMSAKIDGQRSAIVPFFEWQDLLANPVCPQSANAAGPMMPASK
nr:trypsin-like serine protease [Roseibium denhamense]